VIDALNRVGTEDALATAFLYRIAGRWNFVYVRKGNRRWWPDHGLAASRNQTHYIFRPTELVMESGPEFNPPSITDRFVYGSVRGVSADLFDVKLQRPDDPSGGEIKRFKLSANGKTLELAVDAEGNAEPHGAGSGAGRRQLVGREAVRRTARFNPRFSAFNALCRRSSSIRCFLRVGMVAY
jgi:hypothetical protein